MRERKVKSAIQLKVGDTHLTCSKCGQAKEMTEKNFHRNDNSPVGFVTVCKECKREYYRKNKEKKLSYQHEYIKRNIEFYREYNKLYSKDRNKAKEFTLAMFRKQKYMEKSL